MEICITDDKEEDTGVTWVTVVDGKLLGELEEEEIGTPEFCNDIISLQISCLNFSCSWFTQCNSVDNLRTFLVR